MAKDIKLYTAVIFQILTNTCCTTTVKYRNLLGLSFTVNCNLAVNGRK